MAFISCMEMPTAQASQANTTQKPRQENSAFDDLFFGESQQSQSLPTQPLTNSFQTAINIQNNNISVSS